MLLSALQHLPFHHFCIVITKPDLVDKIFIPALDQILGNVMEVLLYRFIFMQFLEFNLVRLAPPMLCLIDESLMLLLTIYS